MSVEVEQLPAPKQWIPPTDSNDSDGDGHNANTSPSSSTTVTGADTQLDLCLNGSKEAYNTSDVQGAGLSLNANDENLKTPAPTPNLAPNTAPTLQPKPAGWNLPGQSNPVTAPVTTTLKLGPGTGPQKAKKKFRFKEQPLVLRTTPATALPLPVSGGKRSGGSDSGDSKKRKLSLSSNSASDAKSGDRTQRPQRVGGVTVDPSAVRKIVDDLGGIDALNNRTLTWRKVARSLGIDPKKATASSFILKRMWQTAYPKGASCILQSVPGPAKQPPRPKHVERGIEMLINASKMLEGEGARPDALVLSA